MDRVAKSQTRLSAGGFQWFLCSGPDPGILPLHSLWSSGNFFHFPDLIMFSITVLTWTAQPGICFSSLSALVTTVCPSELKYHYQRLSLILQSILLSSLYSFFLSFLLLSLSPFLISSLPLSLLSFFLFLLSCSVSHLLPPPPFRELL